MRVSGNELYPLLSKERTKTDVFGDVAGLKFRLDSGAGPGGASYGVEGKAMAETEVIRILDGLSMEIVVSSKSSNYTCCVFIETTPPGGGPPPHKHLKEEEIFTVLEGSYELYNGEEWAPMTVGRPVLSVRNTYHAFRNVGQTAGRMMLTVNGGGIDDYFRAISGLTLPNDLDRLMEISDHYGYFYRPPSEG